VTSRLIVNVLLIEDAMKTDTGVVDEDVVKTVGRRPSAAELEAATT
jgi:hypothetical protein